jgi:hypothetical protein
VLVDGFPRTSLQVLLQPHWHQFQRGSSLHLSLSHSVQLHLYAGGFSETSQRQTPRTSYPLRQHAVGAPVSSSLVQGVCACCLCALMLQECTDFPLVFLCVRWWCFMWMRRPLSPDRCQGLSWLPNTTKESWTQGLGTWCEC